MMIEQTLVYRRLSAAHDVARGGFGALLGCCFVDLSLRIVGAVGVECGGQ